MFGSPGATRSMFGLLAARDADEQRVAVGGVEPQADRRVRAGMAVLAERLEDVRLNRVEVRRERADRAAAAYEPVAGPARRERAAGQGYEHSALPRAADSEARMLFSR